MDSTVVCLRIHRTGVFLYFSCVLDVDFVKIACVFMV